jgi:hypothetical protein
MARRLSVEAIAFHEAGHAVMSFAVNRAVRHVSIIPDGNIRGFVATTKGLATAQGGPSSFEPDARLDGKSEGWIDREVMVIAAGPVAERRFLGQSQAKFAVEGDYRQLMWYAENRHRPGYGVRERYVSYMVALVEQRMSNVKVWVQVEALAKALLERRGIAGKEAKGICQAAALDTDRMNEILDEAFFNGREKFNRG